MKMRVFHVLSATPWLALFGLTFFTRPQTNPSSPGMHNAPAAQLAPLPRIKGIPAGRDMLRIIEGAPYTVPNGKIFVLTGLTRTLVDAIEVVDPSAPGDLDPVGSILAVRFNGVPTLTAYDCSMYSGGAEGLDKQVIRVPPGITASSGTIVSASEEPLESGNLAPNNGPSLGVALGYVYDPATPALEFEGIPAPDRMLVIREGTPLVVPAGKIFVATGVGVDSASFTTIDYSGYPVNEITNCVVGITINGGAVLSSTIGPRIYYTASVSCPFPSPRLMTYESSTPSILEIPPGLTAQSGSTVSVSEVTFTNYYDSVQNCNDCIVTPTTAVALVWGYLADN
jgi:hypothetical protein